MRPESGGGATPMLPKNGRSGISNPGREESDLPLEVEAHEFRALVGKEFRKRSSTRREKVHRPGVDDPHLDDAHLQHVSGFGASHRDRPHQEVRPLLLHLLIHLFHVGSNRVFRNAERAQEPRSGDHVLDVDHVPRIDGEDGWDRRVVITPDDGVRRRLQAMSARLREPRGANRANRDRQQDEKRS